MQLGQSQTYLKHESLNACADLAHAFLCRDTTVDVDVPKDEAVQRLAPFYQHEVERQGFSWTQLQTAEQTHGSALAIVERSLGGLRPLPTVDGLLTNHPGVLLGIMTADCCAVSIVDPIKRAIALVHSGKRGTESNISSRAITQLRDAFGSSAADLVVQLSPCIRPPHYEVDIAKTIREQAAAAGVPEGQIHDEGYCTASDEERFYSYRREKGFTGRHLALLGYPAHA